MTGTESHFTLFLQEQEGYFTMVLVICEKGVFSQCISLTNI